MCSAATLCLLALVCVGVRVPVPILFPFSVSIDHLRKSGRLLYERERSARALPLTACNSPTLPPAHVLICVLRFLRSVRITIFHLEVDTASQSLIY